MNLTRVFWCLILDGIYFFRTCIDIAGKDIMTLQSKKERKKHLMAQKINKK